MAAEFNYTGGREGTHAVTLCKPVGGGVFDVENVPIELANSYIDAGYQQCQMSPEDGAAPQTGYCVNQPVDADHPTGLDCMPAPSPTPRATPAAISGSVLPTATHKVATTIAHKPTPHMLPRVGDDWSEVAVAVVVAVIVMVVIKFVKQKRNDKISQ